MKLKATTNFIILLLIAPIFSVVAHLPDYSKLVEDNYRAVVKILRTEKPREQSIDNLENLPPFFREFFDQIPREQGKEPRNQIPRGVGSGFIVDSNGYILTNYHVIENSDEITVRLHDRGEFEADIVGYDKLSDLAVLKIDAKKLPTVGFADSDLAKVGSSVIAIGAPFGLDYSVSAGIISAIGRSLPSESGSNYVPFIQTDVAINPGNSGGPLFNANGEVVGVNSQIFTRSGGYMGLSFSIPSNLVKNVYQQIKEKGTVDRGYLGVIIQDVDKNLALSFGLDKPTGALLNQVIEGEAADKAGLKAGDIILFVDKEPIIESSDLPHIIGLVPPNTTVALKLLREGKERTIKVNVGSLSNDIVASNNLSGDIIATVLGVEVSDINQRTKSRIRSGGVRIESVYTNTPAEFVGLQKGDIIVQLGYSSVGNINDLVEILESIESEVRLPIRYIRGNSSVYDSIVIQP